jgi:formamidopyrimidine-DNA glycosylase
VPEGLEIEYYRRLAEGALGRPIVHVAAPDAWYLKRGLTADVIEDRLVGRSFCAARRVGKLLLLDLDGADAAPDAEPAGRSAPDETVDDLIGLRFGMTGVLEVDGHRALEKLEYSSLRAEPAWIRFEVRFDDGGSLAMRDPRRLGGVELEPDLRHLGPDALTLTPAQLRHALEGSDAPLKARLMDQQRVAGLGNLLTDEILWRSRMDPARPARSLDAREVRRLHRHLRSTLDELLVRGGSHTGDLMAGRARGGRCPRCGTPLDRRQIGGRTTYSCPRHQR